jgi:DNA polymerase-3 subunit gamma/tau
VGSTKPGAPRLEETWDRRTNSSVILSEARTGSPASSLAGAGSAQPKDPEAVRATNTASTFSTTAGSLALAPEPSAQPDRPQLVEAIVDLAASAAPEPDLDALQSTLASALAAVKGQQSASDAIHDATLTLAGDTLQIQTAVSKAMLPTLFNADANRSLTATLRASHPNLKFTLLPGTPAAAAPKKKRPAATGSAAELAENHPMVQEAKRLFSAEISNVIDLRDKD